MIEDFELAKERGIVAPYAKGFMAYDSVNGNIRTDYNKTARMLAQDAAITPANVGVPSAFTAYIDPKIVQILFQTFLDISFWTNFIFKYFLQPSSSYSMPSI